MNETESKFKTKPYKHQLDTLNKSSRREFFAQLDEMGTGKTWVAINTISELYASESCTKVLVFAPCGVHTNWTRIEIPKHLPGWVDFESLAWSTDTTKKYEKKLIDFYDSKIKLKIFSFNHEALQHERSLREVMKFAMGPGKLIVIVDEADAFKNPSAIRTKNLMKIKPYSSWRRIMTGTPVTQSPFDIFAPFSFLDENILRTSSFYCFKSEYAELLDSEDRTVKNIMSRNGSKRVPQIVATDKVTGRPKYRNLDKLSALIAPHCSRVLKADCLDLPDKIYKNVFFTLTKEQRAIYNKVKKECRLVFENEESSVSKLTAIGKLCQITSGYYHYPGVDEPVRITGNSPKLDLLIGILEPVVKTGAKIIIWARYTVEINDIYSALTNIYRCVKYNGSVTKIDRTKAIDEFEHGDAQIFIANQQAAGTGLTLVAASCVIYFSNDFSLRNRLQSEDRAHRIGQTKNVIYINLIGENTIDEKIIACLMDKKDIANAIVDDNIELFK
jgi:SNF2 family DNA or RNA helicase